MVSSSEPPRDGGIEDVAGLRAEALDVVSDALLWRLAEARWQTVEQVLIAMEAAVAAGDPAALASATADLELAGPLRITRIGSAPAVSPAPAVRDRLNRLVHSLGGVSAAAEQEKAEQAGTDDDRARDR